MPFTDVVVLLPGILGSALTRDGSDVWAISGSAIVGGLLSLGKSVQKLKLTDLSTDPSVAADGIVAARLLDDVHMIPGLWKIDGYTKIANTLVKELGLERDGNFFPFPYDWRRDNRVAAKQLAAKARGWLASWRQRPGNADAKLILVGHSMGGLVARHFLEVLDGWRDTRMLITFGTPYQGSLNALNTLSNGLKVGVGPFGVDLSPLAQSLPSLHQLLPVYTCYDAGGGTLARCYEAAGIPNLDQAKAQAANDFHREIERAVTQHLQDNEYMKNRYVVHPIVGRTQRTLQSARLAHGVVEMLSTYQDKDYEGDGTVPRVSATPHEYADKGIEFFADELHASLQNHDAVLVNVVGLLKGLGINAGAFNLAQAGSARLRLEVQDAYPADQPITMKTTVVAENPWLDLEASIVDIGTGKQVRTQAIAATGEAARTVSFAGLPQGTYRVSVEGDGVSSVRDVFLAF